MHLARSLFLVGCVVVGGCGDSESGDDDDDGGAIDAAGPDAGPTASAARGGYLMDHMLACGDCHTPRLPTGEFDPANYLAGVECLLDVNGPDVADGCLNSRNLTDHETGLATRSDAEIKTMFLDGVRPNGDALQSFMPYWLFHNMTDVDADSIVLYLRTVTGVDHTVPPSDPVIFPVLTTPAPPFAEADLPQPTTVNAQTLEGRYYAGLICIDCHTPRTDPNDFRSLDMTYLYAGGEPFPAAAFGLPVPPFPEVIYTMNLTPHATGLADYTADDVVEVLLHGLDPDGMGVCPPMPAGPMGPFGGLTREDAEALAAYVKALPPIEHMIPNECAIPTDQ
jgi:mono/diheme cytochrome c family protein